MPVVARHRASLRGSIFKVVKGSSVHYLCFVYASQQPVLGCFAVVRRLGKAKCPLSWSKWHEEDVHVWSHRFALEEPTFVYSDEQDFWEFDYMLILSDCFAQQGGFICSDAEWLQWPVFRAMLEPHMPAKASSSSKPKVDELLVEKSWVDDPKMLNFWEGHDFSSDCFLKAPHTKAQKAPKPSDGSDSESEEGLDLEELDAELYKKRLELEERCLGADAPQFDWYLRGGEWTAEHKGVGYDCVATRAKTRVAGRMLQHFGLQKSKSYSVTKFTDEHAMDLARCWCDLHAFMLEKWLESGEAVDFDMQGALAAFVETPPYRR